MVKDTEATLIDNGAIAQGGNPRCSHEHPELCKMKPGNQYDRGCSREDGCRGPPDDEKVKPEP